MTAQHDLPTQIACARRAFDQAPSPVMQSIINTLEWLSANEPKVKAKIEAVEWTGKDRTFSPPDPPTSKRVYRERCYAWLDFAKGGWSQHFHILDDTGAIIGKKTVAQPQRGAEITTRYFLGEDRFDSAKEFIAAFEKPAESAAA